MKNKINSLDIDESLKKTLEKLFLNDEGQDFEVYVIKIKIYI